VLTHAAGTGGIEGIEGVAVNTPRASSAVRKSSKNFAYMGHLHEIWKAGDPVR